MLKTSIKTLKYLTLLIVLLIQIQRNCAKTISDNSNNNHIVSRSSSSKSNSNNKPLVPLHQTNVNSTTKIHTNDKNFRKAQPSNQPKNSTTLTAACKHTHNSAVVNLNRCQQGKMLILK